MRRYTEAYLHFVERLPEVETLYKLANQQLRSLGLLKGGQAANPLCRAGVVLLSSHIEGYVEELSELILRRVVSTRTPKKRLAERFLYYFSKDMLDEIGDTRDPDKISAKIAALFDRDKDIWCAEEVFNEELPADRFVSGFSTPRFDQIQLFIARFGYKEYKRDLARTLEADFQPCTNMVDNVVHQRNKIAHGDAVTAATPADVAAMLKLVRLFCRSTDVVVGNWFRKLGCPIR